MLVDKSLAALFAPPLKVYVVLVLQQMYISDYGSWMISTISMISGTTYTVVVLGTDVVVVMVV